MNNYVKVVDNNVVEIIRNTTRLKPAGTQWKPLETNKPEFDPSVEVLVVDYREIKEDKVIEVYRKEPINFEPIPEEDMNEPYE